MFTGLVGGTGTVAELERSESAMELTIAAGEHFLNDPANDDPITLGESIAINGCCLTVINVGDEGWTFQAGAETLSRTNLGRLDVGHTVNLERALKANARLGGHFVQGHVDAVATVDAINTDGEWIDMFFQIDPAWTKQMVPKGSITVDGISLTLVNVEASRFSVALIPHTLEITTLGVRNVGDAVNVETDILGKYICKLAGEK